MIVDCPDRAARNWPLTLATALGEELPDNSDLSAQR